LKATLSETHPTVLACQSDLALILMAQGKYKAAEITNRAVLEAREHGPWEDPATHPDTLTSMHQLAEVLRLKEGCQAAQPLSERVLTDRTLRLTGGTDAGNDFHPDQLSSIHHQAIVLSGIGHHTQAKAKILQAITGRENILGSEHPDTLISKSWKGEILRYLLPTNAQPRSQSLREIEDLHNQSLASLTRLFGSEHPSTLECQTRLALIKHEQGLPGQSEAEALNRRIYRSYQRNFGDLHPETLRSMTRWASSLRNLGPNHQVEAKRLWREAVAGFGRVDGGEGHATMVAWEGYETFLSAYRS